MSQTPDRFAELEELLGAAREGAIADEQMERLDRLLATDSEARQFYLEYMELCSTLRHYQGRLSRATDGPDTAAPPATPLGEAEKPPLRSRRRQRMNWIRLAIAATLVLGVGLGSHYLSRRDTGPALADAGGPPFVGEGGVAVLTRVVGAEWEQTDSAPAVGSALTAGRLKLRSGLAQLEFYSGATVILEGPADFELLATDRAFCRKGKLRAKVQPAARGFSIGTPKTHLVDVGTEFGLSVQETGAAEVYVFDGKVELFGQSANPAAAVKQEVTSGRGVHIDAAGVSRPTDSKPKEFVGVLELEERLAREARRRYQAWLAATQKLRADPSVLVYYTFEDQQRWDRTLRNQAPAQQPALDGAIVGCSWIDGRWPGKGALEFKRPSDRVRLTVPGEYNALTWMAWVRVDGLEQRYNALLLTDGFEVGAPHWQINRLGQIQLGVRHSAEEYRFYNYYSSVVFRPDQLGQWKHLVTVYDAGEGYVAHYVNGQRVGRKPLKASVTLSMGSVEIGNWGVPLSGDRNPVRNLNGRMDEFLLFDRTLAPEEIQGLYQAGEPIH